MTNRNPGTQGKTSLLETLLQELWKLLSHMSFSAEKGSYQKGKSVCILIDQQPSEQPNAFDVGLTVFPLTEGPLELANIGIATTGSMEGHPNVRPLRRGVTNRRGCMTLRNLPTGRYRLFPAKSVVSSETSLPLPQRLAADSPQTLKTRYGDFSSSELRRAVGAFASEPELPVYQEYRAEDGSLTCTLYESEGELFLHFEASSPETGDVWVEYEIVEQDSERVVTVERQGKTIECTGQVQLDPVKEGRYTKELSLGHDVLFPQLCCLRAYPIPAPSREGEVGGQY